MEQKIKAVIDDLYKHADAINDEPNAYYGRTDAIYGFTYAAARLEQLLADMDGDKTLDTRGDIA